MVPIGEGGFAFSPPSSWKPRPAELVAGTQPREKLPVGAAAIPVPGAAYSSDTEGLCITSTFLAASGAATTDLRGSIQVLRDHFSSFATLQKTSSSERG